ncbi:MAG: hypothetical protein LBO00_05105 [Zoogloeaceae bacterium]|nr:hypothetical protein [Zoogloeaceae bacterium]
MMTQRTDWLPGKREAQIAMSENWQTILTTAKVSAWNIPTAEVTALKNLTTEKLPPSAPRTAARTLPPVQRVFVPPIPPGH